MDNRSQPVAGFANIQGGQLYYEIAGSGQPLVLIHAGVADSRMWDDQVAVFAQHYQVIRYDLRGFGQSPLTSGVFANYEDVADLLRLLGVERAHVVGASYGGQVAIDFALAHPDMVDTLVLVAPNVGGAEPSDEMRRFGEEENTLLERGDIAGATELNLRMWVDGPQRTPDQVDGEVRERVRVMQFDAFSVPTPDDVEEHRLMPPAIERLNEIQAPTLVIVGDLDVDAFRLLAERVATETPSARLVTLHGVAHMVTMERPDAFNQLVLDFLTARVDSLNRRLLPAPKPRP